MVYFAILLICAGLGFLGLYIYLLRLENQPSPNLATPQAGMQSVTEPIPFNSVQKDQTQTVTIKPQHKNPSQKNKKNNLKQKKRTTEYTQTFKQAVDRIVDAHEPAKNIPNSKTSKPEKLKISGSLYLDHSRELIGLHANYSEMPAGFFDKLKRIGTGQLVAQSKFFQIQCDNASWKFPVGDLDQILFQKTGLALVPIDQSQAIALFLSSEAEHIKQFVKKLNH